MADETIGPVWVTKYAGSGRVYKLASAERSDAGYLYAQLLPGGYVVQASAKRWANTRAAAVEQVERIKAARIASLEKQLAAARAIDPEQIVPA